jgi:hypothetical protein
MLQLISILGRSQQVVLEDGGERFDLVTVAFVVVVHVAAIDVVVVIVDVGGVVAIVDVVTALSPIVVVVIDVVVAVVVVVVAPVAPVATLLPTVSPNRHRQRHIPRVVAAHVDEAALGPPPPPPPAYPMSRGRCCRCA